MKRKLLKTADGSFTLHIPEWNEQYHSKNGAITEALHVFIKEGLYYWHSVNSKFNISILEIGFGTGLNSILTYLEAESSDLQVNYTGVEGYPLSVAEALSLNYTSVLKHLYKNRESSKSGIENIISDLHDSAWEKKTSISQNFQLSKLEKNFSDINDQEAFDIIYFDAFGIRVQPELWTEEMFQKMFEALKPNGILVTYAANGNARRALQAVGFMVDRLLGPPGKKEMMRATKLLS